MNRRLRELAAGQVEFYHLLMPSFINSFPKDLQNRVVAISNPEPEAKILAKPDIPDENGKFTLLYTGRLAVEKGCRFSSGPLLWSAGAIRNGGLKLLDPALNLAW